MTNPRLVDDGLVAESSKRPATDLGEERRRYYKITALGQRVLGAELRRLQALVSSPEVRAAAKRLAT